MPIRCVTLFSKHLLFTLFWSIKKQLKMQEEYEVENILEKRIVGKREEVSFFTNIYSS